MKKNKNLEERRNRIPNDVKIYVDMAFKLADRVNEILQKQGKSQRDFATALGKNESEISKWLSGEHNLTLRSLAKMQAELGESLILFPQDVEEKIDSKAKAFFFGGNFITIPTPSTHKSNDVHSFSFSNTNDIYTLSKMLSPIQSTKCPVLN